MRIPTKQPQPRPQVWRVGLMGANANPAAVQMVVTSFRDGLAARGYQGAAKT